MNKDVLKCLDKCSSINDGLAKAAENNEYPNIEKAIIVSSLFHLSLEYHYSIALLIKSGLYGAAFALFRPLYESVINGLWINACAQDLHIKTIYDGKRYKFPKLDIRVKDIDKSYLLNGYFSSTLGNLYDSSSQYTHSGIHQICRRFKDGVVTPHFECGEIVEVLDNSSKLVIINGIMFFKSFGLEEDVKLCENLLIANYPR